MYVCTKFVSGFPLLNMSSIHRVDLYSLYISWCVGNHKKASQDGEFYITLYWMNERTPPVTLEIENKAEKGIKSQSLECGPQERRRENQPFFPHHQNFKKKQDLKNQAR